MSHNDDAVALADLVGQGKILCLSGSLPLGDHILDLRIQDLFLFLCDDPKNAAEPFNGLLHPAHICAGAFRRCSGVAELYQLEDCGYGVGRIEIVLHGRFVFFHQLHGLFLVFQFCGAHGSGSRLFLQLLQLLNACKDTVQAVFRRSISSALKFSGLL